MLKIDKWVDKVVDKKEVDAVVEIDRKKEQDGKDITLMDDKDNHHAR